MGESSKSFWDAKNDFGAIDSMLQRPRSSNAYSVSFSMSNLFNKIIDKKNAKVKNRPKTIHIYKDNNEQIYNDPMDLLSKSKSEVNDRRSVDQILKDKNINVENKNNKGTKLQVSNVSVSDAESVGKSAQYSSDPINLLGSRPSQKKSASCEDLRKESPSSTVNTIRNELVDSSDSPDKKHIKLSSSNSTMSSKSLEVNGIEEPPVVFGDDENEINESTDIINVEKYGESQTGVVFNTPPEILPSNNIDEVIVKELVFPKHVSENVDEAIDNSEEEHEILSISSDFKHIRRSSTISLAEDFTMDTSIGWVCSKNSNATSKVSQGSNYGNFQEEDLNVACDLDDIYSTSNNPDFSIPAESLIVDSYIVETKEYHQEKLDSSILDYVSTPTMSQAKKEIEGREKDKSTPRNINQQHKTYIGEEKTFPETSTYIQKELEETGSQESTERNEHESAEALSLKSSETEGLNSLEVEQEKMAKRVPSIPQQKRKSKLAELCSKTNGGRAPLRVGLSKRVKIDSLHNYLNL